MYTVNVGCVHLIGSPWTGLVLARSGVHTCVEMYLLSKFTSFATFSWLWHTPPSSSFDKVWWQLTMNTHGCDKGPKLVKIYLVRQLPLTLLLCFSIDHHHRFGLFMWSIWVIQVLDTNTCTMHDALCEFLYVHVYIIQLHNLGHSSIYKYNTRCVSLYCSCTYVTIV